MIIINKNQSINFFSYLSFFTLFLFNQITKQPVFFYLFTFILSIFFFSQPSWNGLVLQIPQY